MLNKHSLLFIALLCTTQLYAAVPIESRGLSQSSSYNNTSSTATPTVNSNPTWDLVQKNQNLENDIRTLRGQLEEQANEIDQLKKELTNRYTDLDQRIELLLQKIDPESANANEEASSEETQAQPATATPVSPIASNSTSSNLPQGNSSTQAPSDLEKAAYTVALDAYKQGGAKKAIAPMQNFIKNHPNSIYTGNAYFWLAEFNLAVEPPNYKEAKKNYAIVADQYPTSAKASRALYQLYSIAKDVDKDTASANRFKNKLISTYPKSEEAGYFKS
ncbi:MAG TPA: hypothetical protein DIC32_00070 [Acinetobacter radioresistens]|jgi:TolA-binding protein|uniref:YbgF trimerisation domain-containing protein n=2 Tax=Moraxellaceae TaxID=468 RepID=A0A3D3FXB0_ACIRA|nr:YbgF trimerization domain-containing protein [Acinetobacter radioresistens]EJO37283.1 tetratricopeptide repeat protein [Acinetobacter radioresistens WC-A-157]MCK4080487.1 tetratricopeptide repeat protein [Acinetobacter radioresistens]MCU4499031.1 tetratricopeptide repeat protein [Acinetobacter radioresistens]HCM30265.1 hypothetical protein [Acinetobacter radioresistens]